MAEIPLAEKIKNVISEASTDSPPGEIFLVEVWPQLQADYERMTQALVRHWNSILLFRKIPARVDGRVKTIDSIEASLHRRQENKRKVAGLKEVLDLIHDLAGIRITADYPTDIESANQIIMAESEAVSEPNYFDSKRRVGKKWDEWFGAYQSINHHVVLKAEVEGAICSYAHVVHEIQLTSLPESLYNRLAHPFLYKAKSGELTRKEEMIIDLTHGIAFCYSICTLLFQDYEFQRDVNLEETGSDTMREAGCADQPEAALGVIYESFQCEAAKTDGSSKTQEVSTTTQDGHAPILAGFGRLEQRTSAVSILKRVDSSQRDTNPGPVDWNCVLMEALNRFRLPTEEDECMKRLFVINPETQKSSFTGVSSGIDDFYKHYLRRNQAYNDFWANHEPRLMWITGDFVRAKSMVICDLIEELQDKALKHRPISYFFCESPMSRVCEATSVLRGLIWFLCLQHPPAIAYLHDEHNADHQDQNRELSLSRLEETLNSMLSDSAITETVFLIDGLEFCSHWTERLELINVIIRLSHSRRARWVITSTRALSREETYLFYEHAVVVKLKEMAATYTRPLATSLMADVVGLLSDYIG